MKIFGITNGGVISTLCFFAVPVASTILLATNDVNVQVMFIISAILCILNIIILYGFDDTEMVRGKGEVEKNDESVINPDFLDDEDYEETSKDKLIETHGNQVAGDDTLGSLN